MSYSSVQVSRSDKRPGTVIKIDSRVRRRIAEVAGTESYGAKSAAGATKIAAALADGTILVECLHVVRYCPVGRKVEVRRESFFVPGDRCNVPARRCRSVDRRSRTAAIVARG